MRWWLRSRRGTTVLPLAFVAFGLLTATFLDEVVYLPTLVGSSQVLLMLFAPLPLCAAVAVVVNSRVPDVDPVADRPIATLDAGLVAAIAVGGALVGYGIGMAFGSTSAAVAGRNATLLIGATLLLHPLLRHRAAMVPVAWVMAVVLLGRTPSGDYAWWTVLPASPGNLPALAATSVLFAGGMAVLTLTNRVRQR